MPKKRILKIRPIEATKLYTAMVPSEIGIMNFGFKPNGCDGCHAYGECDEHGDPPCLCDVYDSGCNDRHVYGERDDHEDPACRCNVYGN